MVDNNGTVSHLTFGPFLMVWGPSGGCSVVSSRTISVLMSMLVSSSSTFAALGLVESEALSVLCRVDLWCCLLEESLNFMPQISHLYLRFAQEVACRVKSDLSMNILGQCGQRSFNSLWNFFCKQKLSSKVWSPIHTTDNGRYTNHVVGELMISGKFPIANIAISRTAMIDVVIIVFTLQERSEAMGTFDLNCRSYWLFRAFFGL